MTPIPPPLPLNYIEPHKYCACCGASIINAFARWRKNGQDKWYCSMKCYEKRENNVQTR